MTQTLSAALAELRRDLNKLASPKVIWSSALVPANVVLAVFLATTTAGGLLLNAALMLGGPVAAVSALACARQPRHRTAAWLLAGTALFYGFFWSIVVFDQRHDQPPCQEAKKLAQGNAWR
jgi:ABC-type Fe3+-siderophore transport system permease subunit